MPLLTLWLQTPGFQNYESINLCCANLPSSWSFCRATQGNEHNKHSTQYVLHSSLPVVGGKYWATQRNCRTSVPSWNVWKFRGDVVLKKKKVLIFTYFFSTCPRSIIKPGVSKIDLWKVGSKRKPVFLLLRQTVLPLLITAQRLNRASKRKVEERLEGRPGSKFIKNAWPGNECRGPRAVYHRNWVQSDLRYYVV